MIVTYPNYHSSIELKCSSNYDSIYWLPRLNPKTSFKYFQPANAPHQPPTNDVAVRRSDCMRLLGCTLISDANAILAKFLFEYFPFNT